ncbi:class I SAM-dependent methyltransferase [Rufibacter hautae]|uniref:Class I SAM-dependent methyltransferase n=1 Tax=Rufibacter hautae TaxID=2595005 RepID=A0A5B6T8Z5_9BACT|nr:class I SAM-dependent methyltransferase [Rufibacter hautae]KAA3436455.1 class I SAM-dependent methyltransferase [Rufibacter hautae]
MQPNRAPDFNFIAPVYDALAQLVYGKAQKQAQAHFLTLIPEGARVLVLGGGSGWILPELLRQSQPSHVLFLEPSAKMMAQAQKRLTQTSAQAEVEFRLGTEANLRPEERFHVVLTPFVLDLFPSEIAFTMMQRLDQALLPAGLWLHTDFQMGTSAGQKLWQKPMLWGMYRFFRVVSDIPARELPPFEALYAKLGYKPHRQAFFFENFICAQVFRKATK